MSVGIMDADMSTYTLVPFNLEAMKLSAYYKKKNQLVVLAPSFTPERHQSFWYLKDYNDGDFPINLLTEKNVQYTGLAFSNNHYSPLPSDIEKMKPDTSLYTKMEKIIKSASTNKGKKIFQNMITSEHLRLSLDNQHIWEDYDKQLYMLKTARNIMFHDYDLNAIEGGFEEVSRIMRRARTDGWATKIGMKFPVQVNNGQDLLNWSSLNTNSTFYSLRYNGVIDDDAFIEWVGTCRDRAVFSQVEYYVTAPWYEENHFIKDLLPKIFKQVIISRSYKIFFSLKYDENFFTDKRWCDVIKMFNFYHNSYTNVPIAQYLYKIEHDTLFDFVSHCAKEPKYWYGVAFNIQKMRDLFNFVKENHYELFKGFYEYNANTLGGKL